MASSRLALLIQTEHHQLNLKEKRNTDIILIPQPSDDINDPLNWPAWKKAVVYFIVACFAFVGNGIGASLVTALVQFENQFHESYFKVQSGLYTWPVFAVGVGVPLTPFDDSESGVELHLDGHCYLLRKEADLHCLLACHFRNLNLVRACYQFRLFGSWTDAYVCLYRRD